MIFTLFERLFCEYRDCIFSRRWSFMIVRRQLFMSFIISIKLVCIRFLINKRQLFLSFESMGRS